MADISDRRQGVYHGLELEEGEQRRIRQWDAVQGLLQDAWHTAPAFRKRLENAGMFAEDLRSWDAFGRIPVLRKKNLIALQRLGPRLGGLLTVDLGALRRLYFSPGPIADPEGLGRNYWGWAEAFFAAGFRRGDLVQMTFGYHLTPAGLMLEEPLRELECAVIPAGPGNTAQQVEIMTAWPVTGFVGMASFLRIIRDRAVAQGFDPRADFHLQTAFVAAERLTEGLREEMEQSFGMTLRQGYGTADLGCVAYECFHLGGMHVSSRCLVEICDPQSGMPLPEGEVGEVVVTPFNPVYPLIRFATGDLSRLVTAPCPCGRTSSKLAGILGRADDTAKVKGQFIYPHQVGQVMADYPAVRRWQVRVTNPKGKDRLSLVLELSEPVDVDALRNAFQEQLKLRPELQVLSSGQSLAPDVPALLDERSYD
ncbi:MAG TPA: phenylacetate--CoA ligase family protein [Desulfonatronum sp.]|nr:phenylacetate--CoA ligase family protein [Desulfonatronum sp.]